MVKCLTDSTFPSKTPVIPLFNVRLGNSWYSLSLWFVVRNDNQLNVIKSTSLPKYPLFFLPIFLLREQRMTFYGYLHSLLDGIYMIHV